MKELILLRGLPGSGKSTLAKLLIRDTEEYFHVEADMYHTDGRGDYKWKAENVQAAHKWCQEEVELLMILEHSIVVSNTFTQEWEMKPYYELAKKHGYKVYSLVVENRHNGENIHNVPEEILNKMEERFEIKLK